ncbi:MAG: ubiquinol-cytochrome C chaperone family protein [Alphaproteobacteria bacterium]
MPMSFSRLFLPKAISEAAHNAYVVLAEYSRAPRFYRDLGVADTLDGRFDMMALVIGLAIRRLNQDQTVTGKQSKNRHRLAQELFDYMFDDMDRALREMGVGDLSVGKKIKKMAHAFYGRVDAYGKALDTGDRAALIEALQRNLYRGVAPTDEVQAKMADEVEALAAQYAAVPIDDWLSKQLVLEARA